MAVSNKSINLEPVLLSCMLTEDKITNIFANLIHGNFSFSRMAVAPDLRDGRPPE